MVNIVLSGKWRDHQQWEPRTITTPARYTACRSCAASSRTGQIVVAHIGLVYDRIHSVIVPTIGIVVRDDDSQVPPFRTSLKPVNGLNEKCLLIDRIGISRVTIESALRFQVAYGR